MHFYSEFPTVVRLAQDVQACNVASYGWISCRFLIALGCSAIGVKLCNETITLILLDDDVKLRSLPG